MTLELRTFTILVIWKKKYLLNHIMVVPTLSKPLRPVSIWLKTEPIRIRFLVVLHELNDRLILFLECSQPKVIGIGEVQTIAHWLKKRNRRSRKTRWEPNKLLTAQSTSHHLEDQPWFCIKESLSSVILWHHPLCNWEKKRFASHNKQKLRMIVKQGQNSANKTSWVFIILNGHNRRQKKTQTITKKNKIRGVDQSNRWKQQYCCAVLRPSVV